MIKLVDPNSPPLARLGHPGAAVAHLTCANGPLRALCSAFLEDLGSTDSGAQWAARFGMTRKTLARACRRELRMTFSTWQRAVRVEHASRG